MRLLKRAGLILLILLLLFIANILITTGFFRSIEPYFDGEILQKINLPGAEDISISYADSFALISSTDRGIFPPLEEEKGGLFLIDLRQEPFTTIPLTETFGQSFAPHGISWFKKDSSYQVMAINHTLAGHSIEVFELKGQKLQHLKTLRDPAMISPNDLVLLDEDRFYFTNDHGYVAGMGRFLEEYGGLAVSNVVYFDGKNYREVADGIAYANGINYNPKKSLLFVASPRKFAVKVYKKKDDDSLTYVEDIPCGTGVDNIELDQEGNLWIGAHPNLLRFAAYAKGQEATAPSEIIKIDYREKGDYTIEKIWVSAGEDMSASTVAAPFGDLIFVGNVMDDALLVLEQN